MPFLDQAGMQAADDRMKGMGVENPNDPMEEAGEMPSDPIAIANQIVDLGMKLTEALGAEEQAEPPMPSGPPMAPPAGGPPPMA